MNMIPQGYALYAAAATSEEGEPCLCMVVGWILTDNDSAAEPVMLEIGRTQMAYVVEPDAVAYIGPDLAEARRAAGLEPAERVKRIAQHERADERGVVHPCESLAEHAPHIYGTDHPIRCAGWPPQPA